MVAFTNYMAKRHFRELSTHIYGRQYEAVFAKPKRAKGDALKRGVEASQGKGQLDPHLLRFTLRHYAGDVTYTAEAWLDKDRLGLLQDRLAFRSTPTPAPTPTPPSNPDPNPTPTSTSTPTLTPTPTPTPTPAAGPEYAHA